MRQARRRKRKGAGRAATLSPEHISLATMTVDLPSILTFTIQLARQAGAKIKHGSATRFEAKTGVDEKKNQVDVSSSPPTSFAHLLLPSLPRVHRFRAFSTARDRDGSSCRGVRQGADRCRLPRALVHRRGEPRRRREACPLGRSNVSPSLSPSPLSVF